MIALRKENKVKKDGNKLIRNHLCEGKQNARERLTKKK